jgi:hypothetical protein
LTFGAIRELATKAAAIIGANLSGELSDPTVIGLPLHGRAEGGSDSSLPEIRQIHQASAHKKLRVALKSSRYAPTISAAAHSGSASWNLLRRYSGTRARIADRVS